MMHFRGKRSLRRWGRMQGGEINGCRLIIITFLKIARVRKNANHR